jgi:PPM family protein phosphatase
MSSRILSYAATNVGRVRKKNEDYHFVGDSLGLYVLADGMGGRPQGEVASKLAVEAVVEFITSRLKATPRVPFDELLKVCVLTAHARIQEANQDRSAVEAMGTTLCVLLVNEQHFAVANVGDTRSYWVSSAHGKNILTQITHDDSFSASQILNGLCWTHTGFGLTQALGINARIQPHVVCGILKAGDVILMCSDGITDYIPQPKFRNLVFSLSSSPRDLVSFLIQAALDGGGGDNCTCICVRATY